MKISFECECIILQKSLLLFCKKYIAHHKDCDFIVSDRHINTQKPLFVIGSHIDLPFSKQNLLNALEEFYSAIQIKSIRAKNDDFEVRLDNILKNFKSEILNLIGSKH